MAAPMAKHLGCRLKYFSAAYRHGTRLRQVERHTPVISHTCTTVRLCSSNDGEDKPESKPKSSLNLAKPLRKEQRWAAEKQAQEVEELKSEVSEEIVTAAKDVAETLPGDKDKILMDLLQKLKSQSKAKGVAMEEDPQSIMRKRRMDALYARNNQYRPREERMGRGPAGGPGGDRDKNRNGQDRRSRNPPSWKDRGVSAYNPSSEWRHEVKRLGIEREMRSGPPRQRIHEDIPLFDGGTLEVFTDSEGNPTVDTTPTKPGDTLFDVLERERFERSMRLPPSNAFEEMSRWTKEGKMWRFPIDNEQGLDEEAAVPFHQHVFLEHLIEDFPQRGPIRTFMELVILGLSNNPHMTVQEKGAHVDWFRQYFEEKKDVMDQALKEQEAAKQKELEAQAVKN